MALIPLKARAGIAALTFAAAMAPFVSAIPVKARHIKQNSDGLFPLSARTRIAEIGNHPASAG